MDRDWSEDCDVKNGNFYNNCAKCEHAFKGHKRRITCKVCDGKRKERDLNSKSESRSTI